MASAALAPYMSVEEYLSTSFRPDVDYVDGQIEERNLGEMDHGILQFQIAKYFDAHRREWNVRIALDTRMQVSKTRFRVPDVSILDLTIPKEQVIRRTPILCVEVLSPEDTMPRMLRRIEDYFAMGVPHVWIFDPQVRKVTLCEPGGVQAEQGTGVIKIAGTPIAVEVAEIFGALDED